METIIQWVTHYGYVGIFSLLMLGVVGIPVPDEILLIFAGYLVMKGDLAFWPTLAAAGVGAAVGLTISYTLGRTLGLYLVDRVGPVVHVTPERLDKARRWFERTGRWGLMVGCFVPGFRHLMAYLAGTTRLTLRTFALFAYSGAVFWVLTFVTVGRYLGEEWKHASHMIHRGLLLLSLVVMTGLAVGLLVSYAQKRSRR